MKILFLCHRHPFPPKRGGKIRPFNLIKHLSAQGHEVHVCSLVRSLEERNEGKGLDAHCASTFSPLVRNSVQTLRMIARIPTRAPSSMGYFYSSELKRYIDGITKRIEFDLIFVHCSSVAQYVEGIRGIRKILDYGDIDSQKWLEYVNYKPFPLSTGYWLEGTKLMREESRLVDRFDICTATTRGEMETLQSMRGDAICDWFPNGVDSDFYSPSTSYDKNTISFVGRFDYFPNQEAVKRFVKEVFPIVRKQNNQAKFLIIGAQPSSDVLALAKVEGVSVTGTVPDVREFVRNSAVNVANLAIARGTQNKILEAMSMGVPVVASAAAAKGVDAIPNEHILVSDDPRTVAAHVIRLMEDPKLRNELGATGRNRVVSNHSWLASMKKFDSIVERALKTPLDINSTARAAL